MSIGSHGLEVGRDYELNIGSSFLSGRAKEAYHLMRYDFKPASIDTNRPALFVVGENKQCTVTIPNIQDSGNTTTTYKGGKKSCTKDCVLIIDKQTGQVTLERIKSTIPLKKCRADKQTVAKAHSEMENMESMEKTGNLKKMLKGRDRKEVAPKDIKSEKKTTVASKPSKEASQTTGKSSKSSHPPNPSTTFSNTATSSTVSAAHNSSGNTTTTSSVHSSTVNGFAKTNPSTAAGTIPRKRLMSSSDMSVSSTSSDSSDSDSGDEGDPPTNQLGSLSAGNPPSKSMNAPVKSANPLTKSANPPSKSVTPLSKTDRPAVKMELSKTDRPAVKMERSPAKPVPSSAPLAKVATVKGKEKSFLSTLQSDLQLSDSCSDSD